MLACIGYAVWDTIQDVFRNFKKSMLEHIKDLEIPYNKEKIEEMRNKFKFGLLPELIKIEELRGSISKLKKQIEHWESRTGKECPGLDDIKRTLHSMESHLDQLETMVGIKKEDAFDAAYIKKKQISEMKDAEIYELTKKESKFNEILETIDQEWNYIMKSGLHDFLKDINGYLGKQIDNLKYMDIKFETRELELQKARPGLLSRIMGSHEEEVEKIDLELKQIKKERAYIERLRLQLIDESERLSRDDIKLDLGVRKSTPKRVEGSPVEQLAISHLTDIQSFNVNMLHELKHLDQQKSKLVKQFPHLFSLDALD